MAKTCIVRGGPAGSGEHIFPACLGGHRVNNGIYCDRHNNDYGPLAAKLSTQLAFFNAQFGIRNTRTKQIQPVTLTDSVSGATYEYDGNHLKPAGPRVLSQNGNSAMIAVKDEADLQRFLKEQEAKGITYKVLGSGTRESYHPGQLRIELAFGGPEGLRAIGYVAQTFFAHCYPDLARDPAMRPFIDYTLQGIGDHFVWWDFDAPELPPNAFTLGHCIIVGADADIGVAYARVTLFSTLDFAMVLYDLPSSITSCSVVNYIDPLALKMPEDLMQRREACAVAPVVRPADPKASLAAAIKKGEAAKRNDLLMRRAEDHRRRLDAEALLEDVRAAGDLAGKQQVVREFWARESQRVMRLLGFGLSTIKAQRQQADPIWRKLVAVLEKATERDEAAPTGLTPGAETAIKVASTALSDAMTEAIRQGTLNQEAAEMYIGGGKGSDVATRAALRAKGLSC
jgi:hypothetical protein